MAVLRTLECWSRLVWDRVSGVISRVRTRVSRRISAFVEAARTLWASPDGSRDVPGPVVRVESTDQVQPVAVAPLVIVPPAQVVGPVPVPVAIPVTVVPGLVPVPARMVPLVTVPGVGPQVISGPAQPATVPCPAPEPELPTVRSSVIVTEEDIVAGEISRTVVRNGCKSTRNGPVFFTRRKRLHKPTELFGEPVPH